MFRNVSSHIMIPKTQHLKYTNNTQEDENGEDPHAEDPTSYDPEEQDQEYAGDSDSGEPSETVVGDLSSSTKVSNGEEDEVCIHQGRAKLFKMVESIIPTSSGMSMSTNQDTSIIDTTTTTNNNNNSPETLHLPPMTSSPHDTTRIFSKGIIPSVPPSSSAPISLLSSSKENDTTTPLTTLTTSSKNEETQATSESKTVPSLPLEDDTIKNKKEPSKHMEWKEVGIGPLRLLQKTILPSITDPTGSQQSSSEDPMARPRIRIVQRRETTPGGHGTKLILNVPIRNECKISRSGDKFVRLVAFEATHSSTTNIDLPKHVHDNNEKTVLCQPVQYLFKVKTVSEADALQQALESAVQATK